MSILLISFLKPPSHGVLPEVSVDSLHDEACCWPHGGMEMEKRKIKLGKNELV